MGKVDERTWGAGQMRKVQGVRWRQKGPREQKAGTRGHSGKAPSVIHCVTHTQIGTDK